MFQELCYFWGDESKSWFLGLFGGGRIRGP